jgi:hypothetical protein
MKENSSANTKQLRTLLRKTFPAAPFTIHPATMMHIAAKSLLSRALPLRSALNIRAFASVGDQIPNVELHKGFPPEKINIRDYCENKSVILLGLPVRCFSLLL